MTICEGKLVSEQIRVGTVAVHFSEFITSKLLGGALDGPKRLNAREEKINMTWVPDTSEIPLAAARMAINREYDTVIYLGAAIRGSTSHYDYVCSEVSKGIAQASLSNSLPVMFEVLTTDTIEQAIERAGTKTGNRGYKCALGAIEMVNLFRKMKV